MNELLGALAVGLPSIALLVILFGYVAYRGMIRYRMRDEAFQRQAALEAGDFDPAAFDLPWIEEDIASPGGYALRAHALEGRGAGPGGEPKLALFHHGIGWGWLGMIRYMEIFRAEGWTVVAYDSRGHGRSGGGLARGDGAGRGGPRPSYGFYEKEDLKAVADWALVRFSDARFSGARFSGARFTGESFPGERFTGERISPARVAKPRLVVFGESMGAATVLQYAPLDPRLDAVIADCAFSSAVAELDYRLKAAMVPPGIRALVVAVADAFCRRLEGFSLREADPARAILETEVPMLFIHGLEDRYVPWRMSVVMAETRRRRLPGAVTELLLMPGARHAQSIRSDRGRYAEALRDFLESALAKR